LGLKLDCACIDKKKKERKEKKRKKTISISHGDNDSKVLQALDINGIFYQF